MNAHANGQSLARLFAALEGFFVTYAGWPSALRIASGYIDHLKHEVLAPEAFIRLTEKIKLIADASATVVAENANGQGYNYGLSGFPKIKPVVRARDWLNLGNTG
jgi:hypothetical protein